MKEKKKKIFQKGDPSSNPIIIFLLLLFLLQISMGQQDQ